MVHSKDFRLFAILPLALYGVDLLVRLWRSHGPSNQVNVLSVRQVGSKGSPVACTILTLEKKGFKHHAGDYVFLCVPTISVCPLPSSCLPYVVGLLCSASNGILSR